MSDTATLITQLRILLQLTRTEAQVARLRIAQARDEEVRRELAENATNADRRSRRIAGALRDVGTVPDPLTPTLGRLTALLRGALEQAQPLDEALLGDLALEHQLLDRARYLGALADSADLPAVGELADDLVTAHTATVAWLTDVVADVARGAPAALQASPFQRVAAQVTQAVNAPGRAVSGGLDRAAGTVAASQDALAAGRDAAVQAAESVTHQVADATSFSNEDTGTAGTTGSNGSAADAAPLPVPGYSQLGAQGAIAAIRSLDDPDDVAAVLTYEQSHGDRPGVVAAARTRAGALGSGS
jgi:hypothetical protein